MRSSGVLESTSRLRFEPYVFAPPAVRGRFFQAGRTALKGLLDGVRFVVSSWWIDERFDARPAIDADDCRLRFLLRDDHSSSLSSDPALPWYGRYRSLSPSLPYPDCARCLSVSSCVAKCARAERSGRRRRLMRERVSGGGESRLK